MAFPTLSENGATIYPNFPIEEGLAECTIKSKFEAGYVLGRAIHSRRRKLFKISYTLLSDTNKGLLETHLNSVLDITPFDWTHPKTSVTYTVRYQMIYQFQMMMHNRWSCNFILEQL